MTKIRYSWRDIPNWSIIFLVAAFFVFRQLWMENYLHSEKLDNGDAQFSLVSDPKKENIQNLLAKTDIVYRGTDDSRTIRCEMKHTKCLNFFAEYLNRFEKSPKVTAATDITNNNKTFNIMLVEYHNEGQKIVVKIPSHSHKDTHLSLINQFKSNLKVNTKRSGQ